MSVSRCYWMCLAWVVYCCDYKVEVHTKAACCSHEGQHICPWHTCTLMGIADRQGCCIVLSSVHHCFALDLRWLCVTIDSSAYVWQSNHDQSSAQLAGSCMAQCAPLALGLTYTATWIVWLSVMTELPGTMQDWVYLCTQSRDVFTTHKHYNNLHLPCGIRPGNHLGGEESAIQAETYSVVDRTTQPSCARDTAIYLLVAPMKGLFINNPKEFYMLRPANKTHHMQQA